MDMEYIAALLPQLVVVGFLLGCIPMVIGLGVHVVFHILKNIII